MSKLEEKKLIADYKKLVEPNKQTLFVETEWQIKNGVFTKFSLYSDSCNYTATTATADNLSEIKL